MAAGYNQLIMRWVDSNGLYCTNFFCTQNQTPFSDAGLQAVWEGAQGISQCGLVFVQFQQTIQIGGTASSGSYSTIYDRAMFLDNASNPLSYGQMQIPGLKAEILKPNQIDIDMNNPLVTAFTGAAVSALALPPSQALAQVYSGRRTRVRTNQA
jgi:hypothetical protein